MKTSRKPKTAKRLTFEEKVRRACVTATRMVRKQYREAGRKMPIWKDGRVVYVSPPSR